MGAGLGFEEVTALPLPSPSAPNACCKCERHQLGAIAGCGSRLGLPGLGKGLAVLMAVVHAMYRARGG